MNELKPIEVPETPITDAMFIKQGWERVDETDDTGGGSGEDVFDDDGDVDGLIDYYYWLLPLPKDNPAAESACLISSANDEYGNLSLPRDHYIVEIANSNGIGLCATAEDVEILYNSLTGQDVNDDT